MLAINLSEMWPCIFGRYTNIIAAQIHLQCVSIKPSSKIKVTYSFQFQNHLFSELEDERGSRKSKKRKVFEQIKKSDCEEQLENVWKKLPKRGKGNKIMKEKEANAESHL